MKNQVQLITYADRLGGGTLRELHALLGDGGALAGLFGGVHILPFFDPIDGADAGFDPSDHTRVDPRLGNWDDIAALAREFDLMADVIVNHISSNSPQFADYAQRGAASPYADLFLSFDAVFPQGATEADLLALYRPRPGLPFTVRTLATGERRLLWTTFTAQQLDIDVQHAGGRAYLDGILERLAASGVQAIRLDAVGYAIKKPGTSCFMLPETFEFIGNLAAAAHARGIEVLVEIHSHYRQQIEIARRVDWVYDFALPPLLLHALHFRTARCLADWIALRPANALNVLDTHDGIGIIDIGADTSDREGRPGLVPPAELDALVERIHDASGGQSRLATGAAASNLDLYQVNCTYYDALGGDDRAYLIARAVQFFLPGIAQVYYVGLLAGGNDTALLAQTGVGRDINRGRFDAARIDAAMQRPVVQKLRSLIGLRNSHHAFGGSFVAESGAGEQLTLRWSQGDQVAELRVDFARVEAQLRVSAGGAMTEPIEF